MPLSGPRHGAKLLRLVNVPVPEALGPEEFAPPRGLP